MSAQDRTQIYQQIIAKCWGDVKFKESLIADPRAVLATEGFIVPAGKTIKIVECPEIALNGSADPYWRITSSIPFSPVGVILTTR